MNTSFFVSIAEDVLCVLLGLNLCFALRHQISSPFTATALLVDLWRAFAMFFSLCVYISFGMIFYNHVILFPLLYASLLLHVSFGNQPILIPALQPSTSVGHICIFSISLNHVLTLLVSWFHDYVETGSNGQCSVFVCEVEQKRWASSSTFLS